MAVYILGAGASCCTDTYTAFAAQRGFMGELRPPMMADFFKVALSRDSPRVPLRDLDSVLKPVGLSVAALERGKAGCANIEHVLSFCDLLQRLLWHWEFGGTDPGAVPEELSPLCDGVRGWPVFGGCPEGTLLRAAAHLEHRPAPRSCIAPTSSTKGFFGTWWKAGWAMEDAFWAVHQVYAPSSPYLSRSRPASPGLCSNYSAFLVNKLRAGDTVITFNYDFLLDRVLEETSNLRLGRPFGPFPTLFDAADGPARFLKLHGSVLWYVEWSKEQMEDYDRGNRNAGETCCRTFSKARANMSTGKFPWLPATPPPQTPEDLRHRRRVEALIVPPTIAKEEHLARPGISQLWQQAERDLSATDIIYVVGYSFPPGDKHVSDMTQSAGKSRPSGSYRGVPVTVVTKPNAQHDEVEDLERRVTDAFPGADRITVARDGSGNTIGFAEWVCTKAP